MTLLMLHIPRYSGVFHAQPALNASLRWISSKVCHEENNQTDRSFYQTTIINV